MMAWAPVMDDMVELDDAVVGRAQKLFLLRRGHVGLDGCDEIIVDGNLVIRGGRPVEKKVKVGRRLPGPTWLRNVSNRIFRPSHEPVLFDRGAAGVPHILIVLVIPVGRRVMLRQSR
jgi:hypothetical protein